MGGLALPVVVAGIPARAAQQIEVTRDPSLVSSAPSPALCPPPYLLAGNGGTQNFEGAGEAEFIQLRVRGSRPLMMWLLQRAGGQSIEAQAGGPVQARA